MSLAELGAGEAARRIAGGSLSSEELVGACLERIAAGRGAHFDLFENQRALSRARQSYLGAIERLRRSGKPVTVAVNKSEGIAGEIAAADFCST